MSTLQSANQYREDSWLLHIGEKSGVIQAKREKRRKAKRTIYHLQCKGCAKSFTCETRLQPYCSHECYSSNRNKTKSMIPCMVCLQSLGFGIKATGKQMAMKHNTVRIIMLRAGVYAPRGSSKIAANRELLSSRKNAKDQKTKNSYLCRYKRTRPSREITPMQRMRRLLRNQIHRMLLHIRGNREMRTEQYVGCSFDEARQRIESQFTRGMTWDNCGSFWHLDHIVPMSSFDLSNLKDRILVNHISNLRPLRAKENIRKGNKIPVEHQFDLIAN